MVLLSGFADEISPSLDTQIRVMKDLGISYFEVRGVNGRSLSEFTLDETKELHRVLKENGLKVSALGSPLGKIFLKDDFDAHLKLFDHMVEQAHILETSYIRMFSFYGADESTEPEVFRRLDAFMDHTPDDITLLHENERDIYGETGRHCQRILARYASRGMKATFDPANFILAGEDTLACFAMLKPYIGYMHVKDAILEKQQVVPAGQGEGHWREILRQLKAMNYQGFYSMEPHLVEFSGIHNLEPKKREIKGFSEQGEGEQKFRLAVGVFRDLLQEEGIA